MTAGSAKRRTPRVGARSSWLIAPIVLFLGALFLFPLAQLLSLSVFDREGNWSLSNYRELTQSRLYVQVLATTFYTAAWTTLITILAAYPLAYLLASVSAKRRSRLILWVLVPFWTSFLVRTFGLIVLLGRNGAINSWLTSLGITDAPLPLIYNFAGVLIGLVHALLPVAVLTMLPVMQGIDRRLGAAAATLGAGSGQWFWRIYFPLSLPGVTAAALLVFISCLGFFITPALLGSGRETMIPQIVIQQVLELLNWGFAGAIGVMLLAASLIVFYLYARLVGLATFTGAPSAARLNRNGPVARAGQVILRLLGRASEVAGRLLFAVVSRSQAGHSVRRALVWVAGISVVAFLIVPLVLLVPLSFTQSSFIEWPPSGFTLKWYETFLGSDTWRWAIIHSILLAFASAMLALVIGVPAAFALTWAQIRGKFAVFGLILAPMIVPRILTAVALFYLYSRIGLASSWIGLWLGHTVLALPFVVITIMAVLHGYDVRLDQAATTLGASRWQTFRRITLPLITPGLVSAFLFAFVTSFDELNIALFMSSGALTTLPKQMWDDAILNVGPTVTAVSTVLLLVTTALVLIAQEAGSRTRTLQKDQS